MQKLNIKNQNEFIHPRVGIGVMVFKGNKVLMHKRKGSHGEGEYAFPGGHLEHGESLEQCVRREVKEETGIEIKSIKFQFLANVKKYNPKHYVHLGFTARWRKGETKNLEPEKSEEWFWCSFNRVPKPIFEMARLAFVSFKTGKTYFDS